MSEATPKLGLPYIVLSQAQKEVTHNSSLNSLDALLQPSAESATLTAPPTGVEGNLYIVGTGATGAWAGQDNNLAQYIGGAWVFYTPRKGWLIYVGAVDKYYSYRGTTPTWQVTTI